MVQLHHIINWSHLSNLLLIFSIIFPSQFTLFDSSWNIVTIKISLKGTSKYYLLFCWSGINQVIFAYIKCLTIKSSLLYLAIYKIFACHTNDGFSLCRFAFIIILYYFMRKEYVFFCKIGLSPFEIRFQSSLPIVFLEITNDVWQKFIISLYIICKKTIFFLKIPSE